MICLFLCAFSELQKMTVSFVMSTSLSVCLFVCPSASKNSVFPIEFS
jgi:Flp pilus assembly protein protease CpaA